MTRTTLRHQFPISYSGNSGYITVEPSTRDKYALVKVLLNNGKHYMIDFHLINPDEREEFDSFGHHITVDRNIVKIDDEELQPTDQVPSPIRSPTDNACCYEAQPYQRIMHQFCDLAS